MPDTSTQTASSTTQQTPGEMLKQARERLGLAQKDIASQLNLQLDVIDAVEKNDKNRLPVATYARGYIRSYARLLKMDADMLIHLYDQSSTPLPEIIPNIKKPSQASTRDKPVRAISYLITFILALLLLAWLQSKYIVGKNSGGDIPATTESGEKTGRLAEPETTGQVSTPPVTAPADTQIQPPPESLSLSLPVITPASPGDTMPATGTPVQAGTTTAAPDTVNPDQITENLINGESRMELALKHDSWIEVYDANKTKLYLGLARAGDEIKLTGVAPFSVLLGYASGVTVRYNDEPFDPSPFANAGIARFTLGAKDNQ
jgi:cytoskeleton protein RodZ